MSRRITELEYKLIEKGYVLVSKEYAGWRCSKTKNYVYALKNDTNTYLVYLDKKRRKVLSTIIKLDNSIDEVGTSLSLLMEEYDLFEKSIKELEK